MPGVGEGAPLGCRKPRHRKEKPRTTFDLPLALRVRELLNSWWGTSFFFFFLSFLFLTRPFGLSGHNLALRDDHTRDLSSTLWSTGKVGHFRESEGNLLNMIYGVNVNGFRDFEWNYDFIYRVGMSVECRFFFGKNVWN